jgi:hypothetical protein
MNASRFTRRAGVETRRLDGAAVLVVPEQHLYFAINRVGARIWDLLAEPHSVETLVAALAAQFEVAESECRREAEAFLLQLTERDLVHRLPLNPPARPEKSAR